MGEEVRQVFDASGVVGWVWEIVFVFASMTLGLAPVSRKVKLVPPLAE